MARQRIHNARAGHTRNSGASWISYSDLMAALVLVFVLILSMSLHQYFTMLETKTKELDDRALQIAAQQVTMDHQNAQIIIIQADLEEKEQQLITLEGALTDRETQLIILQGTLDDKEAELTTMASALANKEIELNAALQVLGSQQAALDSQAEKIESLVGVRSEIISALSTSLSRANLNATVDPATGDIVLDSAVLFRTGSSDIQTNGKYLLEQFIPVYLEVLLSPQYSDYMGQIVIEGHTDDVGTYENNMKLSQERAYEVLMYVLGMYPQGSAQRTLLEKLLTSTGRSESDLVYYPGTHTVDQESSRRVEFKFSLKDAEMIEEMNRLLSGD